jgi:hypothetical protein
MNTKSLILPCIGLVALFYCFLAREAYLRRTAQPEVIQAHVIPLPNQEESYHKLVQEIRKESYR